MSKNLRTEIGIIGFGQFGQFMSRHLTPFFDVFVCDSSDRKREANEIGVRWCAFEEVAGKEIVNFAVPLKSFEEVLKNASKFLRSDALCLDVCSVKIKPIAMMLELLPSTVEIIGTHPLFGPQSGRESIEGLRIAFCPVRTTKANEVKNFLTDKLKLSVLEKTPDEHDREMAHVQALTHFVARALFELHVEDSDLATVSYEELMKAAALVNEDSWELFQTIQQGNPFAEEKRKTFVEKLAEIEKRIKNSY